MSSVFLKDILRGTLGFKGVIFSDSLDMAVCAASHTHVARYMCSVRSLKGTVQNKMFRGDMCGAMNPDLMIWGGAGLGHRWYSRQQRCKGRPAVIVALVSCRHCRWGPSL